MSSSATTPLLDHIVILVPHSFLTSPPEWFANLFTFYPGGRHAGGLSDNALVLFADGSYIEFFAFVPGIDPVQREQHRWGKQKEGTVIDWALTLPGSAGEGLGELGKSFKTIQTAVKESHTGISYSDLTPGGRDRPDGVELKWAISSAQEGQDGSKKNLEPGLLPFWCLDDTKRELRVPYKQDQVVKHPTGAVGVSLVSVTPTGGAQAERLDKVYNALLSGETSEDDSIWDLATLEGEKIHTGGQVRLEPARDVKRVSIALFTELKELEGKKVGGNVDDNIKLEFELVAAK
ncbi:hypothetical protein PFICI_12222 [Pestalotiopsis fici W106-1]|uniref:Glyoxalase-like domain-containing protein n=1 Tax=Pestalotiopsis fici (strain W106-1 / CGMCC3.15140) TaxID=1229662 RepID=W3WN51_PESFW|nr:uncharacterized protein PFICI_12222 [Pestalotiopsis fici W106-1]ETS75278.1 hypothetical protein PFICI_12222 [Pestalotiopsis fici W106-1]